MLVLTRERQKRGWKQKTLADLLNVSKQSVCDWEKGRCFPNHRTIIILENLFSKTHRELFAAIDDKSDSSQGNL